MKSNPMSTPGTSTKVPLETPGVSSAAKRTPTRSAASIAERLLQRKYRALIRKHLGSVLDRLFADFTGLHFHIAWLSPLAAGQELRKLPGGCSACCRLSGSRLLPNCRACGPHHLAVALESERGHGFTCPLGVRNYWLPIRLREETLGVAYLQALELPCSEADGGKRSGREVADQLKRAGATVLSRLKFLRARRLLQFIVGQVQTASVNDLQQADLDRAGRVVVALEREQSRLHNTLQRYLPGAPELPRRSGLETRPEQIVHGLLERIELGFAKPLTLRALARDLKMNAAYLSALFSRVVGMPFKTYLTDLRVQKAKGLLGDCAKTSTEVAFAVGYTSEERFRSVFRKATGLSPKVWRETMRISVSAPGA